MKNKQFNIDLNRNDTRLPLIVIVGPTASGKTSLSIDIAKKYNGEIICADSRSVYKETNIGTAKPTFEERASIPHWGLDLVDPNDHFTVFDFKKYAYKKIDEIRNRGRLPILVGGTGLYVDAVIFDYNFGNIVDKQKRDELNMLSLEELHKYCNKNNIPLPENYKNKRYVVRAIERQGQNLSKKTLPIKNTIILGILTDKSELKKRIITRSEQFFAKGVVDEARLLSERYSWDNEAMKGNIYKLAKEYISNNITLDEMKSKNIILDWRLAKRQITWHRRNKYIMWLPVSEIIKYLDSLLAKIS